MKVNLLQVNPLQGFNLCWHLYKSNPLHGFNLICKEENPLLGLNLISFTLFLGSKSIART